MLCDRCKRDAAKHRGQADAADKLPAMSAPKYTHRRCAACRADRDFKMLNERDAKGRTLMVCTNCNSKTPVPGQKNPTWAELLADALSVRLV